METERPSLDEERRTHARVPICAVFERQGEADYYFTRDLSAGGAFVLSEHAPPRGSQVSFKLSLPYRSELLELDGEVVRIVSARIASADQPAGFGVRFLNPPEEITDFLEGLTGRVHSAFQEESRRAVQAVVEDEPRPRLVIAGLTVVILLGLAWLLATLG